MGVLDDGDQPVDHLGIGQVGHMGGATNLVGHRPQVVTRPGDHHLRTRRRSGPGQTGVVPWRTSGHRYPRALEFHPTTVVPGSGRRPGDGYRRAATRKDTPCPTTSDRLRS
ncbi:MAG TPA: hypothetical protein QF865_00910, partial [Acidimicrobiales bacterium]|nr:hypothetical protein [Acidimicrobiales bacterium]